MRENWSENVRDLNLVSWKFLKTYLEQIHQTPECERTDEQKRFYRHYEKYTDILLNLSDEDIEKLAFSSTCHFEISECSVDECLRSLQESKDNKQFLNPAAFSKKPSAVHDEMLKGFMSFYINEVAEINRRLANFFGQKIVINLHDSEVFDNYVAQILGKNGKKFSDAVVQNSDVNFGSHIDKFEIKMIPRFKLKNLKKLINSTKKPTNVLTMLVMDIYENQI